MAAKTKIRPEAKQINPARGQRWRHRRTGLEGEITGFSHGDHVDLQVIDELGCMTWRSTVPMFLERWSYVGESR